MKKHKHFDIIQKYYEDMDRVVQYRQHPSHEWTNIFGIPTWYDYSEYRIKPNLVTKWKWAYETRDGEFLVSHGVYSSFEEFVEHNCYSSSFIKWAVKLEPTKTVVEEE